MPKVLLVGDTSKRTNWGCRATSQALKSLIAERADIAFVVDTAMWPAAFDLKTIDRGADQPFGARFSFTPEHQLDDQALIEQRKHFKKKHLSMARNVDKHADLFRKHNYGGLNDAIEAVDVILINGEGGVMQQRPPGRRMFFLLHYNARYFGKPIAIINHTADLEDPDLREFAALAYRSADAIRVREPISLASVATLGTGRDLKFAADAAFGWRRTGPATTRGILNAAAFDPGKPYLCVGGTAMWRLKGFAETDRAAFLALIGHLQQRMQIVLVAAGTPEDEVFAELAARDGLPVAPSDYPTQDAVNLLADAHAYVGGRWHTAISALNEGTPTVLFGSNSTNKNSGLVLLFEGTGLAAPFDAMALAASLPKILAELDHALEAESHCAADFPNDPASFVAQSRSIWIFFQPDGPRARASVIARGAFVASDAPERGDLCGRLGALRRRGRQRRDDERHGSGSGCSHQVVPPFGVGGVRRQRAEN